MTDFFLAPGIGRSFDTGIVGLWVGRGDSYPWGREGPDER
jgi:hypothetical protein